MAKNPALKPGVTTPVSGQWEIVRNGRGTGVERTSTQGNPLPPTPQPGDGYRLADATKH